MEIEVIQNKIFEIQGYKVKLDFDLATLCEIEIKRLKESVRRNLNRFPDDFMFELTKLKHDSLKTQFATLKNTRRGQHTNFLPFAFT